jgi:hypothetical protein
MGVRHGVWPPNVADESVELFGTSEASQVIQRKGNAGLTGPQRARRFEDILSILIKYNFVCPTLHSQTKIVGLNRLRKSCPRRTTTPALGAPPQHI